MKRKRFTQSTELPPLKRTKLLEEQDTLLFGKALFLHNYELYPNCITTLNEIENKTSEVYSLRGKCILKSVSDVDSEKDVVMLIEAIKDLSKAIEMNPKLYECYCDRGECVGKIERYYSSNGVDIKKDVRLKEYDAIRDYNYVIENNFRDEKYYFYRGKYYLLVEDYEKAISDFNYAIVVNPLNTDYYKERGKLYWMLEMFKECIKDFTSIINIEQDTIAYFNRGLCYYKLEDYESAIDDFSIILLFNKKNKKDNGSMELYFISRKYLIHCNEKMKWFIKALSITLYYTEKCEVCEKCINSITKEDLFTEEFNQFMFD